MLRKDNLKTIYPKMNSWESAEEDEEGGGGEKSLRLRCRSIQKLKINVCVTKK